MLTTIAVLVLALSSILLGAIAYRSRRHSTILTTRYGPILDIDRAVAEARQTLEALQAEHVAFVQNDAAKRRELEKSYTDGLTTYEGLKRDIALLEEHAEDISFGLYEPHFNFDTSEDYKRALLQVRAQQKALIRSGSAATSAKTWQVGGSTKEGERMTRQYLKILLRAFNAECDAAVAIVSWKNIKQMEERVQKSFAAVNSLGTTMEMSITDRYLQAKLDELRLAYEYENKRYLEREEQRQIREQMREEERAQREFEKAQEEAEKEEARYAKALDRARTEAALATGAKLDTLNQQIAQLQEQLQGAHERKERAVSQAQLTKSGHVYVVSNVGAFGERVYKIGMTRRLEPTDRIRELGDASVPFPFDVHAMIYSENAPELEAALHAAFDGHRINLINPRKEFFRVSLEDIEKHARSHGLEIEFTRLAEAREYRETQALRERQVNSGIKERPGHPASLFGRPEAGADPLPSTYGPVG